MNAKNSADKFNIELDPHRPSLPRKRFMKYYFDHYPLNCGRSLSSDTLMPVTPLGLVGPCPLKFGQCGVKNFEEGIKENLIPNRLSK